MSNDASFTSYAYLFVSGCIRREIRGESGFHVSDKHTGQVEKPLLVDDDSLDRGSNKESESFLYDATMLLEGEDRYIVSMLLKGYQQAEIGRELGIGANGMVIRCKSIVDRLRSYTHD
jgi:DNA-directed RNA polymerase specialized sigma subunit